MQSIIEYPEYSSCDGKENAIPLIYALQQDEERRISRSPAIPLPKSHIHRTASELDLSEGIAMAEFRDQCMFNRLVSGMQKQQKLLCTAEVHRPVQVRQDQERPQSSYDQSCTVEEKWRSNNFDGLKSSSPLPEPCTTDYDYREVEIESSSDSYLPFPYSRPSTPEECIEENQRSIENIISTRRARVSSNDTITSSYSVITDDESSDFEEVFDMEF